MNDSIEKAISRNVIYSGNYGRIEMDFEKWIPDMDGGRGSFEVHGGFSELQS